MPNQGASARGCESSKAAKQQSSKSERLEAIAALRELADRLEACDDDGGRFSVAVNWHPRGRETQVDILERARVLGAHEARQGDRSNSWFQGAVGIARTAVFFLPGTFSTVTRQRVVQEHVGVVETAAGALEAYVAAKSGGRAGGTPPAIANELPAGEVARA